MTISNTQALSSAATSGQPCRVPTGGAGQLLLNTLAAVSLAGLVWQLIDPQSISVLGITLDRLSMLLTLLVAAVGMVTYRFSVRYLEGDPKRARFLRNLVLTVCCAYLLMLATNLLLLMVAWILTGMGLHALLLHHAHRPEARRSARKKFLISRLGDLALLAAIIVAWLSWNTLDLHQLVAAAAAGVSPGAVTPVAMLVVLAALTKSAQFPFHSWLPETMEAPTPVSALMHAGIINAGGALLLRFAPLLEHVSSALLVLVVIGTLTAALGTVAMWAQVKIKRTLAWSTVAQMGFMMVQCGLGAFAPATLHLVAHGCYKAWSFLRSGELPAPTQPARQLTCANTLLLIAAGTFAAIPAMVLASVLVGFSPLHSPGEMSLAAILALATGQMWVGCFKSPKTNAAIQLIVALILTLVGAIVAFALYQGSVIYLTPVLGLATSPVEGAGIAAWIAAAIPVGVFALLSIVYALLPTMGQHAAGRAFHIHALHGFYFGSMADRVVALLWHDHQQPSKH